MERNFDSDINEIVGFLGDLNKEFKDKTVLVAGCCGFLGQIFTRYFLKVGAKVIGMDNFVVGFPKLDIQDENFIFFNHDVCQPLFNKLHEYYPDFIVNCCGIADPKVYFRFAEECMDISYLGTKNVLQLAREKKTKATLLFSSSEIYGNPAPDKIPTDESYNGDLSSTGKRAMYDQFKRSLETVGDVYSRDYEMNVKIVRPFNTYSSAMSLKDNRILPSCMRNILKGESIKLYKPATETRTFCYVTDFINGAIRILLSPGNFDIYNCGNDNPEISIYDLANLVVKITETNTEIELIDPPPVYEIQPQRRCPNINKLKKLGYEPKISLEEGIKRYYNWARKNYV